MGGKGEREKERVNQSGIRREGGREREVSWQSNG
jgi:hypothetical protein